MTQVAPRRLDTFTLASEPGNERLALARVAGTVKDLGLSDARLDHAEVLAAGRASAQKLGTLIERVIQRMSPHSPPPSEGS